MPLRQESLRTPAPARRGPCNLIGTDCENLREVNTKMVLAIDALDAATNVSGVEDTISNAKHALEVANTSFQVIQPIQKALLSKNC